MQTFELFHKPHRVYYRQTQTITDALLYHQRRHFEIVEFPVTGNSGDLSSLFPAATITDAVRRSSVEGLRFITWGTDAVCYTDHDRHLRRAGSPIRGNLGINKHKHFERRKRSRYKGSTTTRQHYYTGMY